MFYENTKNNHQLFVLDINFYYLIIGVRFFRWLSHEILHLIRAVTYKNKLLSNYYFNSKKMLNICKA